MSNEPVFVAIGIACVVAVLLFIVFIIYCVKRQQDKEQSRLMRQRRAREERHRRHLMAANIVRPPPYDTHGNSLIPHNEPHVPVSPPPEYKETATPLPRNRDSLGLENISYTSPFYGSLSEPDAIQTICRNVAPANTTLAGNNYLNYGSTIPMNSAHNGTTSGRYINRTTITTTISNHIHDTFQDRPLSSAAATSERTARSVNSGFIIDGLSHSSQNWPKVNTFPKNNEHLYAESTPRQAMDMKSINEERNSDTGLLINPPESTNPGVGSFYNSYNPSSATVEHPNSHQTDSSLFQPGYSQAGQRADVICGFEELSLI